MTPGEQRIVDAWNKVEKQVHAYYAETFNAETKELAITICSAYWAQPEEIVCHSDSQYTRPHEMNGSDYLFSMSGNGLNLVPRWYYYVKPAIKILNNREV